MSGMYGEWCVVLNISTSGGQNLITFISFENLSSIQKDKYFSFLTPLKSISDFKMYGMFEM